MRHKLSALLIVTLIAAVGLTLSVALPATSQGVSSGYITVNISDSASTFTGTAASGSNAFAVANNGGRIDVGTGASDYLTSNGTTISTPGSLTAAQFISSAASGETAASFTQGARLYFNATDYLYHDGSYIRSNVGLQGTSVVVGTGSSGVQVAGGGGGLLLAGKPTDGAGAYALDLISYVTLTYVDSLIARYRNNSSTVVAGVTKDGKYITQQTDGSGTPGNCTVNKPSGACAVADTASTLVITNSTITAASHVFTSIETAAPTGCSYVKTAVPADGSVTITMDAACTVAGGVKIGWFVVD